jgi:hypothetical protein
MDDADLANAPFHMPPEEDAIDPDFIDPPRVSIAEMVRYFMREYRNGRKEFAAIVIRVDPDNADRLDLVVVFDSDDFITVRGVPRRPAEDEIGWLPVERAEPGVSKAEFLAFKEELGDVLFGGQIRSSESFADQVFEMKGRLSMLESSGSGTAKAFRSKPSAKVKPKPSPAR